MLNICCILYEKCRVFISPSLREDTQKKSVFFSGRTTKKVGGGVTKIFAFRKTSPKSGDGWEKDCKLRWTDWRTDGHNGIDGTDGTDKIDGINEM